VFPRVFLTLKTCYNDNFFLQKLIIVLIGMAIFSCGGGSSNDDDYHPVADAGAVTVFSAGGVAFKMMTMPGGVTFPVGVNGDAAPATVSGAYLIGETETTWQLWGAVRRWALSHGYNIDAGTMGYPGYDTGENTFPLNSQHPVTNIGWYSSVVWCNALTEMVNSETGSRPVCIHTRADRLEAPAKRRCSIRWYWRAYRLRLPAAGQHGMGTRRPRLSNSQLLINPCYRLASIGNYTSILL
jgi:hypothetical protein